MNYRDVYFSRVTHLGETTAQHIRNAGIRSFEKWLAESPHTVRNLSVERGLYFDGLILTNKDKEYQKIMFLNISNDIPVVIGDILNWQTDSGEIEKSLIFQEQKKVNGTYRTLWIVRCNYLLKWIDNAGHLQQSWSYVVSSVDSKIKGNFRTWNNLITPQPNKYAEILMPRYPINRATNFIIEEESWTVVEYDHTSVPGVIYLSTTEGKINSIYDDLVNNIADTDKLAQYQLSVPVDAQNFTVGDEINPSCTLMKNGIPCQEETEIIPVDRTLVEKDDGKWIAKLPGETEMIVQLKEYPTIFKKVNIVIVAQPTSAFSAYIEGPDTIRLNHQGTYRLHGTADIIDEVTFTINNNTLAKISKSESNSCVVRGNDKNKLGICTLSAIYQNIVYTKEIKIIPVW